MVKQFNGKTIKLMEKPAIKRKGALPNGKTPN